MPSLTIGTLGTYYGWDCIFKYEFRGYMSGDGTIIKINPYGYATLIRNNSLDDGDRFEDDDYDGNYNEDTEDDNSENNNENKRIKRIKIEETSFQKIKKIIDDNIKILATMGGLEPEPSDVMDGCYSRIFFGNDDISIQAEVSNLWQYHEDSEWPGHHNESALFISYGGNGEEVARNMTKLMNVFFRIRDILVENGIDEAFFAY